MEDYKDIVDASASAHGFDGYVGQTKHLGISLTTARPLEIGLPHIVLGSDVGDALIFLGFTHDEKLPCERG